MQKKYPSQLADETTATTGGGGGGFCSSGGGRDDGLMVKGRNSSVGGLKGGGKRIPGKAEKSLKGAVEGSLLIQSNVVCVELLLWAITEEAGE